MLTAAGTWICPQCKLDLPRTAEYFAKDGSRKDGLACWCLPCKREAKRRYAQKSYAENPERQKEANRRYRLKNEERVKSNARRSRLLRKYGITFEQYEALQEKQGHVCAICGMPEQVYESLLSVDHDHDSGKVRGLLCRACNLGLGSFKDDPMRLTSAVNYLKESV
jgi:Recombination endonuclease VII